MMTTGALGARPHQLIDALFGGFVLITFAWYARLSGYLFFVYDDWTIAGRPWTLGNLFVPHNGHLSVVSLGIYRTMLEVFGLRSYGPYRLVGVVTIVALTVGIYVYARWRLGPAPAFVAAASVLWMPSMSLTPFLFNFHLALLFGVLCAALLPSTSQRGDLIVAAAVSASLCTSSVGIAVAAACATHALLAGMRLRRCLAVGIPLLGWAVWWTVLGDHRSAASSSVVESVGEVLRGTFDSFEALAGGRAVGGGILLLGWLGLLGWRWARDRASLLTQLAWAVGLEVWWIGLAWSRLDPASSPNATRYRYVGAVFLLLSVIPSHRIDRAIGLSRWWTTAFVAAALATLIAIVNVASIRSTFSGQQTVGRWAKGILVEVERGRPRVPDAIRLTRELGLITAGEHRDLRDRLGSPLDPHRRIDSELVANHSIRVHVVGPARDGTPPCGGMRATLPIGGSVSLHTGNEPAVLLARRFGAANTSVAVIEARTEAVIATSGPSVIDRPWLLEARGGCLVEP